jgi:cobalt/nickel transport system ATP-binding protein
MIDSPKGARIKIEGINFCYEKDRPVLQGLSLDIGAGERFGIIGPSGAGKSTFLFHLNGLLHGDGRVRIDDLVVNSETLRAVRRRVGLVFENPDDQLFMPTIEEDLAFGLVNLGLERAEVRDRTRWVLDKLGLCGFEHRNPHQLSLGERKRAALATVLVMQPDVIAFDEPFANLNPGLVESTMDLIAGLKTTVVIVSQQVIPLLGICDRIAVMSEGKIIKLGSPAEIAGDRGFLRSVGLDFWSGFDLIRRRGIEINNEQHDSNDHHIVF